MNGNYKKNKQVKLIQIMEERNKIIDDGVEKIKKCLVEIAQKTHVRIYYWKKLNNQEHLGRMISKGNKEEETT